MRFRSENEQFFVENLVKLMQKLSVKPNKVSKSWAEAVSSSLTNGTAVSSDSDACSAAGRNDVI